ncbi:MAG: hypothetical protein ACHQ4J_00120 [Candidatus Binatia bacterium]
MDVQLSERAQRALRRLQPAADLGSSIEAVTLDALRLRLHDVAGQLAGFEARYGRTFEQFAVDWNAGRQTDRFSHRVERDFMEWEALTAERRELLELIRELSAPVDAAS